MDSVKLLKEKMPKKYIIFLKKDNTKGAFRFNGFQARFQTE